MKNYRFLNVDAPMSIDYCDSFKYVSKWKIDKAIQEKENGRISKIEIYNYFKISDLPLFMKYLNTSKFKFTDNRKEYPRVFNILRNHEWKRITWKWKIFGRNEKLPRYYYKVLFSRVMSHRNRTYLFKIYWNESQGKDFVKVEITYCYFKPKEKYNIHSLDWLNSLKGINEIIKKTEKKMTPIWFIEDFSKEITLEAFIFQVIWRPWISNINHIYTIFSKLTGKNYYSQINNAYPLNSDTDEDNG